MPEFDPCHDFDTLFVHDSSMDGKWQRRRYAMSFSRHHFLVLQLQVLEKDRVLSVEITVSRGGKIADRRFFRHKTTSAKCLLAFRDALPALDSCAVWNVQDYVLIRPIRSWALGNYLPKSELSPLDSAHTSVRTLFIQRRLRHV